ncbi:MAG: BON domain-containing protein [Bryobacteraceae bacterium]
MRFRLRVAILLLILSRLACAQPAKVGKTTPKVPVADAELEAAIRARFAKSKSGIDKFTVRVQGGVATIEGKTDVVQRKAAATRMAKAAGAKQVINKVEVSNAAKLKAAGNLTEGRRRAQVKRSEAPR